MQNENEQKLKELVMKWTSHFRWRKDFFEWQSERIWQEKYQEKMINFLEKFIPNLKSKKILDLGAGMGGFLVAMKRRGYDIQGLEPNPDYCEITELRGKRYDLNMGIINGSGEKMPFSKDSFDFIYCNDVLEHCKDPQQVLKESHRILEPAGQMYVTVINRFGFKDPHYHLNFLNWMPRFLAEKYIIWRGKSKRTSLCDDRQKLSEMHYFTINQFEKIANRIGFGVQDLKGYKILHPELIDSPGLQKWAKLLRLFPIRPLYIPFRKFYLSGFSLLLRKSIE